MNQFEIANVSDDYFQVGLVVCGNCVLSKTVTIMSISLETVVGNFPLIPYTLVVMDKSS